MDRSQTNVKAVDQNTVNPKMGYRGECQCGNISYRITGEPLVLYVCHCTDCQSQSASAYGMSLWIYRTHFSLRTGKLSYWQTFSESGAIKVCGFCPTCGVRIYHAGDQSSEILSLKAGLVSGIETMEPVAHLWLRSAQSWVSIDSNNYLTFDKEPVDYEFLKERWQESYRRSNARISD